MIRTLIVDDSTTFRAALQAILSGDREFEIVGVATEGAQAVDVAARSRPDLVLMDVVMGGKDGLWATEQIMTRSPCPVVVISSLVDTTDQQIIFDALKAGAVEVLAKPRDVTQPAVRERFLSTLKAMARVKVVRRRGQAIARNSGELGPLIAIGASTGGPTALVEVLKGLGVDCPAPILVAQHLAQGFTEGLARWLGGAIALKVQLVDARMAMRAGVVYLPADGHHLEYNGGRLTARAGTMPAQAPSVDRLFNSLAEWGPTAVGVLLTGMGEDGARGLLGMRQRGCHTVVQDEDSSLVYGMPRVAKEMGAASEELPLPIIGARLRQLISGGPG
jgi:two-component system chemotaxis response regulator CheB